MKILILILIFLTACATKDKSSEVATVSISNEEATKLEIDKQNSNDYGPTSGRENLSNDEEKNKESREPVIQLNIYSSLYASLALVEYLKMSEKENIKFSIILANGFASLISVLYAQDQSVSRVEWKLFELIKKLDGKIPFSGEWLETIQIFLTKEFKQKKLHQLKTLVSLPEIKNNQLILNSTGLIVDAVMKSLSMTNKTSYILSPIAYNQNESGLNPDIRKNISFIPRQVGFKNLIDYEWGVYASYLSFLDKSSNNYTLITTQDESKYYIDELTPLSDMTSPFNAGIEQNILELKESIKQWKEENTTSSI